MKKIILVKEILSISKQINTSGQKIILAGGCFDILHIGHIRFLQKAKALGDVLIILLESDQKIKMMKGNNRPVNSQKDRAKILSALQDVNFVVLLPENMENSGYDVIAQQIKPDFIATTKNDPNIKFKKRTAKLVKAKVKYVTQIVNGYSAGKIMKQYLRQAVDKKM